MSNKPKYEEGDRLDGIPKSDRSPPYSPDFNLAEYIIHLLRLRFLHHLPLNVTIEQIKQKLRDYFSSHQLQTPKQIQNIIRTNSEAIENSQN